jgi:hypothetical protein
MFLDWVLPLLAASLGFLALFLAVDYLVTAL